MDKMEKKKRIKIELPDSFAATHSHAHPHAHPNSEHGHSHPHLHSHVNPHAPADSQPTTHNSQLSSPSAPSQSNADLGKFFDRCAREGLMSDFEPGERPKLETFFSLWALRPEFRVLEPGCGAGRLTEQLAARIGAEGEVYSCDVSAEMLECARRRNLPAHVVFALAPAHAIERPDGWFDRIICLNVFPHFINREEVLREFARVLKPEGELWINHFEGHERLNEFHRKAGHEVAGHALPCRRGLEPLISGEGFQLVDFRDDDEMYYAKAMKRA